MIPPKTKILCVEDDPVSRKLLEHVLSPLGCEVFAAESGQEALEVIARENIDLVLLDILLPGMDGYDVCRTIKGDERTRNIPVIMITGLTSKEDRIKGIEAGAEELLTKPFSPAEVCARVRMLLKVKNSNEMRTGKILIELGLINEPQLQEALKISKEKNIKVGEALYSMGALSRDTIYWGLSNQLHMTYIELSPEMVDKDLVQKFPLDVLKQLQCLPLYETNAEIHFAIADPTDQMSVEAIKRLRPWKIVQLHLGLPEKIADVLSYYEREIMPQPPLFEEPPYQRCPASLSPDDGTEIRASSNSQKSWDDLMAALLSMPSEAVYWLYQTPAECLLLTKEDSTFKAAGEYPAEVYSRFQERLKPNPSSGFRRDESVKVLSDRSKEGQAAFKIRLIDAMDRGFIRLERMPMFSTEAFERSHPLAPRLIAETKSIFEEHRRLVVGGPDKFFIKQICYSLLMEYVHPVDFPPVFFLEHKADIYLPKAAQLSSPQWDLEIFFKSVGEEVRPFVFYEAGSGEGESAKACLSGFLSGRLDNVILCLPSPSTKAMREALTGYIDRPQRGFRAVFMDAARLKPIC